MILLSLEGALARASAALFLDGRLAAAGALPGARVQPTALPGLAARVLAEAGVAGAAVGAVAVGVGPGGFTGLRAALALAEGLALGAGAPLVGVTTGEALAEALPDPLRARRRVWSVVDNRRGRIVLERVGEAEPEAMEERDLPRPPGPVALVGDGAALAAARLLARGADAMLTDARLPDAAAVGRVALRRLAGALPPRAARPLYVEPPAVRAPA